MADTLDSSKIDGLVMIGASTTNAAISRADGMVLIGAPAATLEVSKLDAFTMMTLTITQHENITTGQWIGPLQGGGG